MNMDILTDGSYQLHMVTEEGVDIAPLLELLNAFVQCIEAGCFGEAHARVHAATPDHLQSANLNVQLTNCPRAALRVLGGMAAFLEEEGLPIIAIHVSGPGFVGDPTSIADRDVLPSESPFKVDLGLPNWGRPLCLLVEFSCGLPEPIRTNVSKLFSLWSALVCGGYPPDDTSPGFSGCSGIAMRFLEPQLFEFSAERWHCDSRAFAPLLRGLAKLHESVPVSSVEVS